MNFDLPPQNIYNKSFLFENDIIISIEITPLAYSFIDHRARHKIYFNIKTPNDYGDGMIFLYEDDKSFIATKFIDENITPAILQQVINIVKNDFLPNQNKVEHYLVPDYSI